MTKITSILLLLTVFIGYAQEQDKVYLKNKNVIVGSILRVDGENIEIDPKGEKPFLIIKRSDVRIIIYSDNTIVKLDTEVNSENPAYLEETNLSIPISTVEAEALNSTDDALIKDEKSQTDSSKKGKSFKDYFVDLPGIDEKELLVNQHVDQPATYPGCNGSREKKLKCTEKKINKLISKNYSKKIAKLLLHKTKSLSSYGNLITTYYLNSLFFVIDTTGEVHFYASVAKESQKKESMRVVDLIPKMTPAVHDGKKVNVSYRVKVSELLLERYRTPTIFDK